MQDRQAWGAWQKGWRKRGWGWEWWFSWCWWFLAVAAASHNLNIYGAALGAQETEPGTRHSQKTVTVNLTEKPRTAAIRNSAPVKVH